MVPAPVPDGEQGRLAALRDLGALDLPGSEALQLVVKQVAKAFDAPIAMVSLVDAERQVFKSSVGLPEALAEAGEAPRATSICGHVVARSAPIVVEDVLRDERFAHNPFLRSHGIRFYAGVPLFFDGEAIGTLCVLDSRPRALTSRDRLLLERLAGEVMAELRLLRREVESEPATATA